VSVALAGMVREAWADLDRVVEGLSREDAERKLPNASAFSWTVAHCTHMVDSWLNVNFQGTSPHPSLNGDTRGSHRSLDASPQTLRKGAAGDALDWNEVQVAVEEVRTIARHYLNALTEDDLDTKIDYTGSIEALRSTGISPRYALMRIAAHHYFHIGEIASARVVLGHDVGDYPGLMKACL